MTIAAREWLDLVEYEYLNGYINGGGGVVKFIVGDAQQTPIIRSELGEVSEKHNLVHVNINAAETKLHMIQDVFFAVSRALDWDAMTQHFVEALFERQGYEWPRPGEAVPIHEVAELNRIDLTLLRREFHQWLTAEVMKDTEMTQDFRVAIARLCQRRLEPEDTQTAVTA